MGLKQRAAELRPLLAPRSLRHNGSLYALDRLRRRTYPELTEAELLATRASDTAFVFGSGRSLLEVGDDEWRRISEHATISFSEFVRQDFVRADYHLVGEVYDVVEYARLLRDNPRYSDTIVLLQEGWLADDSNALVARRLLRPRTRVFRYRRTSRGRYSPPSRSFSDGLVHGWNTSTSVTNLALLMGFRRIVLTGIDLYDRNYFWLPEGEARPTVTSAVDAPFPTSEPVIDLFARWRELLEPEGVELTVYNPRSLLARSLEVFRWS
jgi:hypothetical protein